MKSLLMQVKKGLSRISPASRDVQVSAIGFCRSAVVIGLTACLSVTSFSACTRQNSAANNANTEAAAPRPIYFEHTVRYSGETLGSIAKWYTGNTANYNLIARANPGLKADRIQIGQVILIPRELIVHTDPYPAKSAKASSSDVKGSSTTAAKSSGEVDDELNELDKLNSEHAGEGSSGSAGSSDAAVGSGSSSGSSDSSVEKNGAEKDGGKGAGTTLSDVTDKSSTGSATEKSAEADAKKSADSAASSGSAKGASGDGKSSAGPSKGAQGDDVERERLLDELLQQQ